MTTVPDEALRALAARAGIAVEWEDAAGAPKVVGVDTLRHLLAAMDLPCGTAGQLKASLHRLDEEASAPPALVVGHAGTGTRWPAGLASGPFRITLEDGRILEGQAGAPALPAIDLVGYHLLEVADRAVTLAIAPPRCFGIADACASQRVWGLAAQLYGLRRRGDGGIGDFTGLATLCESIAEWGCDAVSIGPVHALFTAAPGRASPYSPSSRLFLNPLHADPRAIADARTLDAAIGVAGVRNTLGRLETAPLVDWDAAGRAKLAVLREVWSLIAPSLAEGASGLGDDLRAFTARGGQSLRDHATFEALHAGRLAADPADGHWHRWPGEFKDPRSGAVAVFAREATDEIAFHIFLQWLADRSLAGAHAAARAAGQRIGLIADLAVGTDGDGSYAWSRQGDVMNRVEIGAPPDLFNPQGQAWGLTAFSPRALTRQGFAPFIEALRAALRHAGGLRIDHVLGLVRLWLVPEGAPPSDGAYLRFPFETLCALIALESHRHRAVIVGEDLGTVPRGLRADLAAAGLLGMRVLWFERDGEDFLDPAAWPCPVAAMTSTHDLPTVAGWWSGRDIAWRRRLGLSAAAGIDAAEEDERRSTDRQALWAAFRRAGTASGPAPAPDAAAGAVATAAIDFVARTPAELALIPVEDLLAMPEQPNLPGTTDEHPNWRQRLPGETAGLLAAPGPRERLRRLARERPRS
ncbi:4-alpha-glucanotransferase [Pseudochelatococcus sp. B33]